MPSSRPAVQRPSKARSGLGIEPGYCVASIGRHSQGIGAGEESVASVTDNPVAWGRARLGGYALLRRGWCHIASRTDVCREIEPHPACSETAATMEGREEHTGLMELTRWLGSCTSRAMHACVHSRPSHCTPLPSPHDFFRTAISSPKPQQSKRKDRQIAHRCFFTRTAPSKHPFDTTVCSAHR